MIPAGPFPGGSHFEVREVQTVDGIVQPIRIPRGEFFSWSNPRGRDLVVFFSTAQPSVDRLGYAHRLLDIAPYFAAERIVTFAALACGLHPTENPEVWGAANDRRMLLDLRRAEVQPISDGEIGGMNGLILGAAIEHRLPGLCLLAEIPFFAMGASNPKASRALLSVFGILSGIELSLERLDRKAAIAHRIQIEYLNRMSNGAERDPIYDRDGQDDPESAPLAEPSTNKDDAKLKPDDKRQVEDLFEEVRKDLKKGVRLKALLDRLAVFPSYEERFLDLFRRAE